jgi:glycosyltransferase involved in cell wall biosynthesis
MSKVPKVSIVVPMYKVEKYLDRCIESLRAQTLKDIQIVLVDDGSPDRSGDIAETYAREDHRITVVHRENGGLGPARNSGMDIAKGDYIGFVDADDWVDTNMYKRMYETAYATHADVVTTGIRTVRDGVPISEDHQLFAGTVLKGDRDIFRLRSGLYGALPCHAKDAGVVVSACTVLYRRSLLRQANLRFMNIHSEDIFFNLSVWSVASVIAVMDGTPYNYRKDGQSSLTTTFHHSTPEAFFRIFQTLEHMARQEPMQFRAEACLRARRGIFDYARVLTEMIETSSQSPYQKYLLIREVFRNPSVLRACRGYPFWKLRVDQMMFFICTRFCLVLPARLMLVAHLRRFKK